MNVMRFSDESSSGGRVRGGQAWLKQTHAGLLAYVSKWADTMLRLG